MKYLLLGILCSIFCCACQSINIDLNPHLNYTPYLDELKKAHSPFSPLGELEKNTSWAYEYQLGLSFAKETDLYRAISCFKRALFLMPKSASLRQQEVLYHILLSYYMGKKYANVIHTFETSTLQHVDSSFAAYQDLSTILYDAYRQIGEDQKAANILRIISSFQPEKAQRLQASTYLRQAKLEKLSDAFTEEKTELKKKYSSLKKSPQTAQILNALLPGSGYFYLGQKQTALTSFLLNGLFIAASHHFFKNKNNAAGIITSSFEFGWYFGGIHGAALGAKKYNEQLYQSQAQPLLIKKRLFPILMLEYTF